MFKRTATFWVVLAAVIVGRVAASIFLFGSVITGLTAIEQFLAVLPLNLIFITLGAVGFLLGIVVSRVVPSTRLTVVSGLCVSILAMLSARIAVNSDAGPVAANYIVLGALLSTSFAAPWLIRSIRSASA